MIIEKSISMNKPHELVLQEVRRTWAYERSKGFFQRLLEVGQVKPVSIIIAQTESFHREQRHCTGNIVNQWRYDDAGLQFLTKRQEEQQNVNYCHYCIDKEKRILIIDWAMIFQPTSTRRKVRYHHSGIVYAITKNNGIDDFEVISSWME